MKKRKLKKYVLPTIYVLIIVVSFLSVSVINNMLLGDITNYDYSKPILQEVTQSVLKEQEESFSKPYNAENVTIITSYYNKDADEKTQQNSLIYYQKTYMPSTGTIYGSAEEFNVTAINDGTVKKIDKDDILGNVVQIEHNANLISYYYSLKDVTVKVGDSVKKGTVLGSATTNAINDKKNNILLEIYYQGKSLDPEKVLTASPKDFQ